MNKCSKHRGLIAPPKSPPRPEWTRVDFEPSPEKPVPCEPFMTRKKRKALRDNLEGTKIMKKTNSDMPNPSVVIGINIERVFFYFLQKKSFGNLLFM